MEDGVMRRSALWFGVLLAVLLGSFLMVATAARSQAADSGNDGFSQQEWATIKTLSPLPDLPVDTTNKYPDSEAAALLGQKLFFDPRLAGPIQTGTPAEGQPGPNGHAGNLAG